MTLFVGDENCSIYMHAVEGAVCEDSAKLAAIFEDGKSGSISDSQLPNLESTHDQIRAGKIAVTAENRTLDQPEEEDEDQGHSAGVLKLEETVIEPQECKIRQAAAIQTCIGAGGDVDARTFSTKRVAVTGAGGFIGSWIVKLLLQRGYHVRGALRDTGDAKTAHLRNLVGADERLELVNADILHHPSVLAVVEGCEGVFHTACPVIQNIADPETQMIKPAVEGTLNVLRACSQAHVKRIVMTSSIGALYIDPHRPAHQIIDESCWSDENHLKTIKEWYCLAKLMAEKAAWDYAESHNVDLVSVCPGITLGTMLQPNLNQSSTHILKYLNGAARVYVNLCQAYVDVKDAAEAHLLAYETPTASGRYLCAKWSMHRGQVVDALAAMYPQYPIPTRCKDEDRPRQVPLAFSNARIEQLGLKFTPIRETLADAVTSLQERGFLETIPDQSSTAPKTVPPPCTTVDKPTPSILSILNTSIDATCSKHKPTGININLRRHRRTTSFVVPPPPPVVVDGRAIDMQALQRLDGASLAPTLHRASTATF